MRSATGVDRLRVRSVGRPETRRRRRQDTDDKATYPCGSVGLSHGVTGEGGQQGVVLVVVSPAGRCAWRQMRRSVSHRASRGAHRGRWRTVGVHTDPARGNAVHSSILCRENATALRRGAVSWHHLARATAVPCSSAMQNRPVLLSDTTRARKHPPTGWDAAPAAPPPPPPQPTDHWGVLGLTPAATTAEIRKAYRSLSLRVHPDKHGGCTVAAEHFKAVAAAHEVLTDPVTRRAHDEEVRSFKSRWPGAWAAAREGEAPAMAARKK